MGKICKRLNLTFFNELIHSKIVPPDQILCNQVPSPVFLELMGNRSQLESQYNTGTGEKTPGDEFRERVIQINNQTLILPTSQIKVLERTSTIIQQEQLYKSNNFFFYVFCITFAIVYRAFCTCNRVSLSEVEDIL